MVRVLKTDSGQMLRDLYEFLPLRHAHLKSSGLLGALQCPEVEIAPIFRKQFTVRAGFDYSAFLQHQDPISVLHGGKAMGDRDHCPALRGPFKGFLNFILCFAVKCAGGFIQ